MAASGAARRRTFLSIVVLATDNPVWKFFLGACALTAAMLQPHAPMKSILAGMGLSALVVWVWTIASRGRTGADGMDKSNQGRSDPDTR